MKKVNLIGWAFMITLLAFVGCREDIIDDDTKKTTDDPIVLVNSSVSGIVSSEFGDPIEGAIVTLKGESISTNEFGIFSFQNESLNEFGQMIQISKPGYFELTKVFTPNLNATSYLSVNMMEKNLSGSFNSSTGGSITTADGASVRFDANEIMMADGSSYNGEVNVYSRWLNPKANNIGDIMPGDLRAKDKDLDRVQLATYGMMVVELETASGEKLQVKDGEMASLTFPLPTELQGTAPSEIPLWSFDDETGYWIEESVATLENGQYVGEVPHFSFWNCDIPNDYINLQGTVLDPNGAPIVWVGITIESENAGAGYGYTNSDGVFEGFVPNDQLLNLLIHDNCGNVAYEQEIGPFNADAELADITLDVNSNLIQFTGKLVDCNGVGVESGMMLLHNGSYTQYYSIEDDGTFAFSKILCDDLSGTIRGYDYDAVLTTEIIDFMVTPGDLSYDFGDVEVCEEIDESIIVETDKPYLAEFITYSAYITPNGLTIDGSIQTADSTFIYINAPVAENETGTFDLTYFYMSDFEEGFNLNCNTNAGQSECPTLNITLNEGSGGYLEGNFAGEFEEANWNGSTTTVNGSVEFRVLLN